MTTSPDWSNYLWHLCSNKTRVGWSVVTMETNSAWFSTNRWRHCLLKSSRTELSAIQSHGPATGALAVNSDTSKTGSAASGVQVTVMERLRLGQAARFTETVRLFVADNSPEIEELFIQFAS